MGVAWAAGGADATDLAGGVVVVGVGRWSEGQGIPIMNARRLPSVVVALFLQFAPLLRTVEPAMLGVLQPVFILLRWASAAAAVAGGAHALSGATGLVTSSTVRGTNGVSLSYRVQITSDSHGSAKSYSATLLPPGVVVSSSTGGIISGTPSAGGTYAARVTGWETSTRSGHSYTATVTFTIVDVAPVISAQPLPLTVTEGSGATFSVAATGTSLTYRWIRDGLELAGATNATFTVNPAKISDAGLYQVRVQNSGGAVLSAQARLTVNPAAAPPVFATSPVGKTVHAGETVILSAMATVATVGVTPTYAWTRDGASLPGTDATLVLSAVTASQAGSYRAIATAQGLSTTSAPAPIVVVGDLRMPVPIADAVGLTLQAQAIPGRRYVLERASDPAAAVWTLVKDTVATGTTLDLGEAMGGAVGFYRLRIQP